MTTYRLFPSTNGTALVAYSGNFLAGVAFNVTAFANWFAGYWWWVPAGGDTGAQKFALWQISNTTAGVVIPGSVITSGTLTAGQWNYVPLSVPLELPAGVPYLAATGYVASHGFAENKNQFGTGDPFAAGITNGPLSAYSDTSGSNPVPNNWFSQGSFGTASADPSVQMPNLGSDSSSNFWMDVQISDTAPSGTSYRLWPNLPAPPNMIADTATNFTLATEIGLSQSCTLNNIWFYSPSGSTQLPTACGIWNVSSQTLVSGTLNSSPAWSGAAGSGWVSCPYSGITLPAGDYKVSVFNGAASPVVWNNSSLHYWDTGAGSSGIVNGPLSAPNEASATAPGQGSYHLGTSFVWPDTYATASAPTYWVDVEVTPLLIVNGTITIAGAASLGSLSSAQLAPVTMVAGSSFLGTVIQGARTAFNALASLFITQPGPPQFDARTLGGTAVNANNLGGTASLCRL